MMDLAVATSIAGLVAKSVPLLRGALGTDVAFIRAYYLEVSKNIAVLEAVDIAGLADEAISSPLFKSLIGSIETEIGTALLCAEERRRRRLLEFLGEGLVLKSPSRGIPIESEGEAGGGASGKRAASGLVHGAEDGTA